MPTGWGAKRTKKQKGRSKIYTLRGEECRNTEEHSARWSIPDPHSYLIFSPLNGWRSFFFFFFEVQFLYNIVQQSFWLGWNSHRGEGWGVAWIAPCCISFWSWTFICLLKSLSIGFKSCFPWRFPLLVEHHTRKVLQGHHQQPVHFSCTGSMFYAQSFLLRCYHISLLDAIPLCHGLLKCKARRWPCLLPDAYMWGGWPRALLPWLSCLISNEAMRNWPERS